MLKLIKTIHTAIWLVMATATFYILYAGITRTFNPALSISIMLLLAESAVIFVNRWTCPLTPWAAKYTTDRKDNFDIFLPQWLARYNKMIFGTIFAIGLMLVTYNYLKR